MSFTLRFLLFLTLDSLGIIFSVFLTYWLLGESFSFDSNGIIIFILLISFYACSTIQYLKTRLCNVASIQEMINIFYSVSTSIGLTYLILFLMNKTFDFKAFMIQWCLIVYFIGGIRLLLRIWREKFMKSSISKRKKVLIIGAQEGTSLFIQSIKSNPYSNYVVKAIVDDDPKKQNTTILDVKICGTTKDIPKIIEKFKINCIIISIPVEQKRLKAIYDICKNTKVEIKRIPEIEDIMVGKFSVHDMRDVNLENLLGREEVKLDMVAISQKLTNKKILVTGAGGSIGSEICRQVAKYGPQQIILLGHGEHSIYTIHLELIEKKEFQNIEFIPIIADIQDRKTIFRIVEEYRPDVIYHAAAHKHVPLMEINPKEAVKNNIFGTKNIAEAAHKYQVSNFVMISTDKAVNPTNVMGATKRIAEMIIQNLDKISETKFVAVRFGNVLGSRGSVVPRFQQQIKAGGPVTITHPEMTRYFMTIPEASRLVLQAGALAKGGEVFVLDMGEPIKIVDLAKNLIELSGYKVEDIGIEFTGIRLGEKLYEELLNKEEIQEESVYPKIHVGKAYCLDEESLKILLHELIHLEGKELKKRLIDIANGIGWDTISILERGIT